MTLADEIVVLSAGIGEQVCTPVQLYHARANKFVAAFIGSPNTSFLNGTITQVVTDGVLVTYAAGETQLVAVEPGSAKVGDAVTVGIRPEHLHAGTAATLGHGVSTTMAVESLGDAAYLYAKTAVTP